jgi:hypothetical protein
MRALGPVTEHAIIAGRHLETIHHGEGPVAHDVVGGVLAAWPMAPLALEPILDVKAGISFPKLGVGGRGVATEAHAGLLGFLEESTESRDLGRLREGQ